MMFMPDKLPPRDYFFNVLYTLYPEHVQKMIDYAHEQRFGSGKDDNAM